MDNINKEKYELLISGENIKKDNKVIFLFTELIKEIKLFYLNCIKENDVNKKLELSFYILGIIEKIDNLDYCEFFKYKKEDDPNNYISNYLECRKFSDDDYMNELYTIHSLNLLHEIDDNGEINKEFAAIYWSSNMLNNFEYCKSYFLSILGKKCDKCAIKADPNSFYEYSKEIIDSCVNEINKTFINSERIYLVMSIISVLNSLFSLQMYEEASSFLDILEKVDFRKIEIYLFENYINFPYKIKVMD